MLSFKTIALPNEILIVRHGESVLNLHNENVPPFKKFIQSTQKIHPRLPWLTSRLISRFAHGVPLKHSQAEPEALLTNKGQLQAYLRAMSILSSDLIPDLIVCSTFERALHTAHIIRDVIYENTYRKLGVISFDFLIEKDRGCADYHGIPWPYVEMLSPHFQRKNTVQERFIYQPPGGESVQQVVARIENQFFDTINQFSNVNRILLVGHAFVNMVLHGLLTRTNILDLLDNNFFKMPNLDLKGYQYQPREEKYKQII